MTANDRLTSLATSVLTVLAVVALVSTLGTGAAAANDDTVSSCTVIASPGVYELGGNVTSAGEDACVQITASDVVLDGAGHTITGSDAVDSVGIHVDGSSGARLSNVTVTNLTVTDWETGLHYNYTDGGTVMSVTASSNGDYGVYVEGSTAITVADATTSGHSGHLAGGVGIRSSTGVTVTGLDSTEDDAGVFIADGSGHAVRNSTFLGEESSTNTGVEAWNTHQVTVQDNVFEYVSPAADISHSGEVLVDNNSITYGSIAGIQGSDGLPNRITNNTVVTDSQQYYGTCSGVSVNGAENDVIANNSLQYCNTGGMIQNSIGVTFENNTITDSEHRGLYVNQGSGIQILNNQFTDNGQDWTTEREGLLLGFTEHATVSGNTLAGNDWNLRVRGGKWATLSHTIDATNTVEGRPVAYHVNQSNFAVDPNAGWVALIGTDSATVDGITFPANNYENVFLWEAEDTLVRDIVSDASTGWYSMRIWSGSNDTVVESSTVDGTRITVHEATHTRFVNTSITNSARYASGVTIQNSADTTFENVTLTGNYDNAIYVYGFGSERLSVRNSTITNNGESGVVLDRAHWSTVVGNLITDNGDSGIEGGAANNATITDNVVSRNTVDGIAMDNSARDNLIAYNLVTDNSENGIELGHLGKNDTVTENVVTGNAAGLDLPRTYEAPLVYDNHFNNTVNVVFDDPLGVTNATWNVSAVPGVNVAGGATIGGNVWANPAGNGFSQTCADGNADGVCDATYTVATGHVDFLPLAVAAPSGTGEPEIDVSPTAIDFGGVDISDTATVPIEIRNVGTAPLNVTGADLIGPNASEFSFGNSITPTVAPGATHTVNARYAPTTNATHEMTFRLLSNDTDESSVDVTLTGVGLADPTPSTTPEVTVDPTTIDFGNVTVGQTATVAVTVRNDGDEPLDVTRTALDYDPAIGSTAFSFTDGGATVLAPGENRSLPMTFAPTDAGPHSTHLTVRSNDTDEPYVNVDLSGTGVAAPATPTPAPPGTGGGNGGSSGSGNGGGNGGSSDGGSPPAPPSTQVSVNQSGDGRTNVSVTDARDGVSVSIDAGTTSGNVSLDGIDVTPLVDGDFTLNVSLSESAPAGAPGTTPTDETPVGYLNVDHSIADADVGEVTFRLNVSKASLAARGMAPADVVVYRYHDGQWQAAAMSVTGETATHYTFAATVPGLSVFAVSGQEAAATGTPTATPADAPSATPSPSDGATPPPGDAGSSSTGTATDEGAAPPATGGGAGLPILIAVAVVAAAALGGTLLLRQR